MNFVFFEMRRKNKNWYWWIGKKCFIFWFGYDLLDIGKFNFSGLCEFWEILENRLLIFNYCWLYFKNLCGDIIVDIDWVND